MSTKYLGQPFDIHGGGLENQFPHHECEIAQSEAANDVPFARYWLHNNMVTVDGQKMGKSLNNFITLKQVFVDDPEPKHEKLNQKYEPLAIRFLILNTHYRSPIDFSDEALASAQRGYETIVGTVLAVRRKWNVAPRGNVQPEVANLIETLRCKFREAMDDDLNTSKALSVLSDLIQYAGRLLGDDNTTQETLGEINRLFDELGGEGREKDPGYGGLGIIKRSYGNEYITAAERFRLERLVRSVEYQVVYDNFDKAVNEFIRAGTAQLISMKTSLPQTWTDEERDKQFEWIKGWIEQRKTARQSKDFKKADAIRKAFEILDIVFEDNPDKTTSWRRK